MESILTEEMVKEHIENQYSEFRSVCKKLHRRGMMTEDNVRGEFINGFKSGFLDYIRDKGFRLSINAAGWTRFLEDYQLWDKGELPASTSGKAWLRYENSEATPLDRRFFFELMAAFNVPMNYFEPLRDGAYHDDYRLGHFPGEMIIGHNIWEDDGGLLSDDFRLGSTINLTDHYGLKSIITVNEFVPRKTLGENDEWVIRYEYYEGYGTIEGYTKPEGSCLELYTWYGKLNSIGFYPDEEDWKAHNSFPLWKEQIEHEEKWRRIYDNTIDGLIRRFVTETRQTILE